MIANKAYAKNKFVYRAYFNGSLIWDYGTYTAGSLSAGMDGSAMPTMEELTPVLMQAEATLSGSGVPHVVEFEPYQAHAEASLDGYASPRAADVVHGNGVASATIQAVGAPSTYSQVFGAGQVVDTIDAQAMPRAVEIEYGAGVADAGIIASLCPTVDEFLQLVMNAGATIEGSATPQTQEPEKIVASAAAELTAIGCAETVPVHHVTFMHNGVELFQASVIDGYDCPDPVASGEVETPTKEMTVQYTYAHSGWSLTEGGEADENALSAISGDIVVYAAFKESLRYYDIQFYDGVTLLKTLSFAYGETPSYTAVKSGYISEGWTPEPVPVTEETHYTAVWKQISNFADASWDEIDEVARSGNAASCYSLGDEKTVTFTIGTTRVEVPFVIVHFGGHECEDGSIAGITLLSKYALYCRLFGCNSFEIGRNNGWELSTGRTSANSTGLGYLPSALQSVIKPVKKLSHPSGNKSYSTTPTETVDKIWIPSITEYGRSYTYTCKNQGFAFSGIGNVGLTACYQTQTSIGTSNVQHGTRSACTTGGNTMVVAITDKGAISYNTASYARMGFCI